MSDDNDSRRQRGRESMRQVYGWDFAPRTAFERQTVDHLFGEVWADGKLSVRDRAILAARDDFARRG